MATYYLVTIYEDKVRYAKVDSIEEAIQLCEGAEFARVQEKLKGKHGCSKYIYEKYNGVVTTNY